MLNPADHGRVRRIMIDLRTCPGRETGAVPACAHRLIRQPGIGYDLSFARDRSVAVEHHELDWRARKRCDQTGRPWLLHAGCCRNQHLCMIQRYIFKIVREMLINQIISIHQHT